MISDRLSKNVFEAFRKGDKDAFQAIMWDNFARVNNFIRKIVKSKSDSKELTQDVFIKLWQSHSSVDSYSKFSSHLFSITHNTIISHLRKTVIQTVEIDEKTNSEGLPSNIDDKFEMPELMLIVSITVSAMPTQRKAAFKMSRIEGLGIDEIAERLNISKSTVKSHLNAALKTLRDVLTLVSAWLLIASL